MLKKNGVFKQAMAAVLCAVLLAGAAGCTTKASVTAADGDILTQKASGAGKIPVTVLVKYAFSANAFEQAAEARFPQLDLIQVGNYTDNSSGELAQRMKNDDLTDLIFTWPYGVGEEYFEERLMDLSAMPFTGRYNTSMLDKLAQDGKLYYLPGPSQVRGLVYNKTMFAQHGWEVPTDYESFLALCKEIEAAGIRPLQLSLVEPDVIETAFWGFGYSGSLSRPKDAQALAEFNDGKGGFGSFTQGAFDSFEQLVADGVLKPGDLDIKFFQRTDSLFARECAMISDGASLARIGMDWAGCPDEFAVMPFFSPGDAGDWTQVFLVCHIGVNKHLAEPKNKEKYDLVMQLMDYISSEEGQLVLAGDDGGMLSSVNNVPLPTDPELADVRPTLESGRFAPFPTLRNAQAALHKGLRGMLAGTMTREDVIKLVNEQNASPPSKSISPVLGTAKTTFSLMETGSYVTDVMRESSGADVALFLDNGKDGKFNARGISAKLYAGDITENDVKMRVLPVLQHNEQGVLQVATMTGADIANALEHTLNDGDWFYYFSGLRAEFAPTATPGSRIGKLTDANNQPLDPAKTYKVAMMDGSVDEKYIQSIQETGIKITEMLCNAIRQTGSIAPAQDGRFVVRTQ